MQCYEKIRHNEEGVSEVISFLFIFVIIIGVLGIIIIFSSPIVEQGRDTANFNNILTGFSVLKTDLDTVALTTSPIRTTKLNIAGGNLYVDPHGTVTKNRMIIKNDTADIYNSTLGAIVYTYKDKKVIYECGGVIESYPAGMLLRENPKINVDRTLENANNTLISIMKITGNFSSLSGEGAAQVIIASPGYNEAYNSNRENLTITINSAYASAWKNYLSDQGFEILSSNDREVSARIINTKVIIGEHQIDVKVR